MRRVIVLLLVLLVAAGARAEDLTIGTQAASDYLPAYVAQQRGMFARHGIAAKLIIVPNGGQVPAGLVSGSLQIGTLTTVLLLQAASQGIPVAAIAGGSVLVPGVRVGAAVTRPGVALAAPGDFAGHVVGISALGSFLHVLFAQWLEDGGADPAAVRYVEMPFPQLGDALKSGRIDAALLVEPFASRALQPGSFNAALPYLDHFPAGTLVNAWCVEPSWAAAHAEAIAGFRAAMAEAIEGIAADPAAARQDLGIWLKLSPEVAASLPMPRFALNLTDAQIDAWNAMAARQKLLDHPVPPGSVRLP